MNNVLCCHLISFWCVVDLHANIPHHESTDLDAMYVTDIRCVWWCAWCVCTMHDSAAREVICEVGRLLRSVASVRYARALPPEQ